MCLSLLARMADGRGTRHANPTALAAGSNRCGVTANYCLAAPVSVKTLAASSTPANPVYGTWTGTGIAAAQVGGAAGAGIPSRDGAPAFGEPWHGNLTVKTAKPSHKCASC